MAEKKNNSQELKLTAKESAGRPEDSEAVPDQHFKAREGGRAQRAPLTKSQAHAVKASGKNVLVSAGAGTGKTRVLVERFLHFVTSGEALVTEILALTFTEKAANEMKTRIQKRFNELGLDSARRDLESAYISTIHSFAARLLREHPLEAGLDPDFRVIEPEEAYFLKEQALDDVLAKHCGKGSGGFELLRVYGEACVRDALVKILDTARGEGKFLGEFFAVQKKDGPAADLPKTVSGLLEALGEKDLVLEWRHFSGLQEWDWATAGLFREWCGKFSKKRGKKGDDSWPEIKRLTREFAARKLDAMTAEWRARFEPLALAFEASYEAKKRELGMLDFDDLQIYAVRLFRKEGAIYSRLLERYRKKFKQIMVDEFQDTNHLQFELISMLAGDGNLFLVGDYKQSIYGFRGAEPRLFLELEQAYRSDETKIHIPLLENFRTVPPVLDFFNLFFETLWREDGILFDGLLARCEDNPDCGTELVVVRQKDGEALKQSRMREADHIAARILELNEAGTQFGDMAILFQAMTDSALYEQALKKNGIPYYVLGGSGFYYQHEIRDMISLLSFLENPLADIPLAAALRSPMFQLKDDTLFWLSRQAKRDDVSGGVPTPLFEGVKNFEAVAEIPEPEKKKIRFFLEVTGELLEVKDQLRLTELLDLILAKTSYELTALADAQGVRKYSNLKKMVNLARELESYEPMPIGAFLRALRRLEMQEARESEAQIEAEQSRHVVRLMSIHRSKGLEFPVVFAADMGHSKQSSEAKTFLAAAGNGYALQLRNPLTYEMEKPWSWQVLNEAENRKQKEEWKRLFYVAVTRARNRLIMTGVYREKKKEKANFHEMSSWMDWLMASDQTGIKVIEAAEDLERRRPRALAEVRDLGEIFENFEPLPPEKLIPSKEAGEQLAFMAGKIFESVAPSVKKPSRTIDLPVSAYAAYRKNPGNYWLTYEIGAPEPAYLEDGTGIALDDEEVSAADFGTLMHQVLEKLPFDGSGPSAARKLIQYYFRHLDRARQEEAEEIAGRFLESGLFAEIRKAARVHRELPFVLNERHGIVHGVIDLLYQDDKGLWHVLDYKTAAGSEEKVKESGYLTQIAIYTLAVHRILRVKPASGTLYFLKNNWEYRVPWKEADYEKLGARMKELQDELLAFTLRKKGFEEESPARS